MLVNRVLCVNCDHYSILNEAVGFYFGGEMEERAAGYLTSEVKW